MSAVVLTEVSERTQILVRCLKNTGTRHLAANVLAAERPADAVEPLAALLEDRSDQVRATVVSLLGGYDDTPVTLRVQLSQLAQTDRNPVVRSLAREALQRASAPQEIA
jgi:HEAT repeat protein